MSDARSDGNAPPRDPRVEDRVVRILSEQNGAIAFNGLRRSLRVHPESLTRALRRLERYGLIERGTAGYRLVRSSTEEPEGHDPQEASLTRAAVPVAEVTMMPGLDPTQVLGLLAGRWAGQLRWVGIYERPGAPRLVWSRTDGPGHVLLGFEGRTVRVFAEPAAPGEVPADLNAAARELLLFALERLRSVALDPSARAEVSAFRMDLPVPGFGPN